MSLYHITNYFEQEEQDVGAATVEQADAADQNLPGEGDDAAEATPAHPEAAEQLNAQPASTQQMAPGAMGLNMPPGGFPNMGWNGSGDFNPMAQFMPNGMFNPQNPMGTFSLHHHNNYRPDN